MKITNLTYTYKNNKEPTLKNLSCVFKLHQVNFLIGENGSGKTTLIDAITRQLRGKEYLSSLDFDLGNDYMYISQFLPMLGYVKCSEIAQVILGTIFSTLNITIDDLEKLSDPFTFSFLKTVWNRRYRELSGGELKLVQILLFLQTNKSVVILDEPSAFIDRRNVKNIFDLINQKRTKQTFIIITHDVRDIRLVPTSNVSLLDSGRIVKSIDGKEIDDLEQSKDFDFLKNFVTY
ncbi:ATP-binding cassette domain-containing protein [Oenococcus oeni]|uniref:ATP-binding cassette domain-containing protein n=1 Tax=Oenococcus oeni TaxID=1247 RepID=UPI00067E134B|nr:energy-coupling factor ABC transporter ATP-binding protein [Oenococcus oeni]